MTRFIGYKNNSIIMVSDKLFHDKDLNILEIPKELESISSQDIILNYKIKNNKLVNKNIKKEVKDLRVAFVSNFKMSCGISTYFENLVPEIINHISDFKIFAEINPNPTSDMNLIGNEIYKNKVTQCWERGKSLQELIQKIKEYDPDIVLIQHEFGLWPNARYWLSMMNQLSEYKIIVTMHSVFYHKDKVIVEASMPNIVVHLEGAKTVLKKHKQISGNVNVIPHGCYDYTNTNKLWNFYKSNHTFISQGFAFRYKNFASCIKATAILKKKYNDVFFTALLSESEFNKIDHELYYKELMDLVNELGIQENVAIIRGFQSDEVLDSYYRTNQVAVFPYQSNKEHECFGSSGAARLAMSKAIPVITSNINHFSDLCTIKAENEIEIANELDKLFSDNKLKELQIKKQLDFIKENSWHKIAMKYLELF